MATDLYMMAEQARERSRELRAENYTGKLRFLVSNIAYGAVTVYAGTMQDAIWTAAKHWKTDPRKAAFHQGCNVRRCGGRCTK